MKKIWVIGLFVAALVIIPLYFALADVPDVDNSGFSTESTDSIGAYYEETWQAYKFLYTTAVISSGTTLPYAKYKQGFASKSIYAQIACKKPQRLFFSFYVATGCSTNCKSSGEGEKATTSCSCSLKKAVQRVPYYIPGATLAQDFVVTEWHTSGHMHFSGGL